MSLYDSFVNINYKFHLSFSLIVRILLIIYGNYHDSISEVKYTDIDYKVFTDAARHVAFGGSPYDRSTYRYSPIIALLLIPNITIHPSYGKLLFSLIDILVALLIRAIVKNSLKNYESYSQKDASNKNVQQIKTETSETRKKKKKRQSNKQQLNMSKRQLESKNDVDHIADLCMTAWLYNPLTIAISTRGNSDSLAVFLVLLTLYFIQCKHYPFLAGIVHGISIHFRLYPIIYSLTYFMYFSKYSFYTTEDRRIKKKNLNAVTNEKVRKQLKNVENTIVESSSLGGHKMMPVHDVDEKKTIFKLKYLFYVIPNFDQLKLISGCLLSLGCFTVMFYKMYGYKFLYETYIYHFVRKDPKHNFSLYFYLQYLTAWVKNIGMWQKVLMLLPQLVLILVFSVRYGLNKISLNFSILTQTIVFVIYNSVLTSQYFVWIMAVLPLCLWQIKMSRNSALFLMTIWFVAQAVWLLPAYLLEFQGQNTFLFIWIQSVSFFCANIAILGRLITYFMPVKGKMG
ncbi:unnamed protein product [Acanthoscelides obtectus]|uniref:GPI alpha-1,4-mannosyltransferase I, catalytic subunit n=1 Tax=Acanthoscelides obtectus TaxID=200917 RepID=A0A9P0LHA4_ACAOB|nr:unnamed protein product [Acanthoscelides obtectus]CAK1658971.1 GPI mannosyltransferase 1 [Acanthoscelides obtectus]